MNKLADKPGIACGIIISSQEEVWPSVSQNFSLPLLSYVACKSLGPRI